MARESDKNHDLPPEVLDRLLEARAKRIMPVMEEILGEVRDRLMRNNLPLTPKATEALAWLSNTYFDGDEIRSKELVGRFNSRDTLNRATKQLLHLGFLEEAGTRPTGRRGRPPKAYRFHEWPSKRLHHVFAEEEWPKTLLAKRVRQAVRREPVRVWNLGDFHVPEYRVYNPDPGFPTWIRLAKGSDAARKIQEIYGSGEAFADSFAQTLELAVLQAQLLAWLRGKQSLYAIGTDFIGWTRAAPPSP